MKPSSLVSLLALSLLLLPASQAAETMAVVVTHDLPTARAAETIEVPWSEIVRRLPGILPNHLLVKDAHGQAVPSQLLNFEPDEHHDHYRSVIFQHSFAPGEKRANFTLEATQAPVPPYPPKASAHYAPERYEDLAWENDRVGHRIYGPALAAASAGRERLTSSGIDFWGKLVPYPVFERLYRMGHYHDSNGEALDFYDVGPSRGCGGLGIWQGNKLATSGNWAKWKVLANGPVRVVLEVTYQPWSLGEGAEVAETRRITLDAESNLNLAESTLTWTPAEGAARTVGIGLAKHPKKAESTEVTWREQEGWCSLWERYPEAGQLGTAVLLPEGAAGKSEDALNHVVLARAPAGPPLRYYFGGGWEKQGAFPDRASWEAYLSDFATRLHAPLTVSCGDVP